MPAGGSPGIRQGDDTGERPKSSAKRTPASGCGLSCPGPPAREWAAKVGLLAQAAPGQDGPSRSLEAEDGGRELRAEGAESGHARHVIVVPQQRRPLARRVLGDRMTGQRSRVLVGRAAAQARDTRHRRATGIGRLGSGRHDNREHPVQLVVPGHRDRLPHSASIVGSGIVPS